MEYRNNNHEEVLVGLYGDSSSTIPRSSSSPQYSGYSTPQSYSNYDEDPSADYEDSWLPLSHKPSSSSSLFMFFMQWLEAVTHPNLGMFVATLLICLAIYQYYHQQTRPLQYLGPHQPRQQQQQQQHRAWRVVLWEWLDPLRERDWLEWLQVQCVLLWDYAHFYSQMGMEMLRSLRLYWDTSGLFTTVITTDPQEWEDAQDGTLPPPQHQQQRNMLYRGATGAARVGVGGPIQQQHQQTLQQQHQHQQQQLQSQQQQQPNRNTRTNGSGGVWSDLPDLEEVGSMEKYEMLLQQQTNDEYCYSNDLEPAFLNGDDYPPGWVVYHAVLGVVTKTEADQYQFQQQYHPQETASQSSVSDASLSKLSTHQNGSNNNGTASNDAESTKHEPIVLPSSITANG